MCNYDAQVAIELTIEDVFMSLIEHIESYLGKISEGWKDNNSDIGLQVVAFREAPALAQTVYMTIGLSRHEFAIGDKKRVRQELVLPVQDTTPPTTIVSWLFTICETILKHHVGVLRGQVLRLSAEAAQIVGFDAAYCAIPVFSDIDIGFATFRDSDPPTVIVWVIPIFASEADFVEANGWSAFEDLLESRNPDLLSLKRDAII